MIKSKLTQQVFNYKVYDWNLLKYIRNKYKKQN